MLHLEPDIHLHEPEITLPVQQKFHGAHTHITYVLHRPDHLPDDGPALFRVHRRRGGFLNELLMSPLDGAVPLPQAHRVSKFICQHLQLHMPGGMDKFFKVDRPITEGCGAFRHRLGIGRLHLLRAVDLPDAPAAAAGSGLQHHGVADFLRRSQGLLHIFQYVGAGDGGKSRFLHEPFNHRLVAEAVHIFHGGTNENHPVFPAAFGKMGVFR